MLTVAVYHKSVPPGNKSQEKPLILTNFAQGVARSGDRVLDVVGLDAVPAAVGVIQGWTHEVSERPHLRLRARAIAQHAWTVAADSNLFLYNNTANPGHYLRYSFNGIFPTTGIYCDNQIDPGRWPKIKRDLNIAVRDYRTNGSHVLLCLQRNGGWSMDGLSVVDWALQTIEILRRHTDRPIVIRTHPGDKSSSTYLHRFHNLHKVIVSDAWRTMQQDLINCWAVVNYNSSSVVGAAIEGYPVFVTDPARSQCRDVANIDLTQIEQPQLPDRQPWLDRISMFHWNFAELASGEAWRHMRRWISAQ